MLHIKKVWLAVCVATLFVLVQFLSVGAVGATTIWTEYLGNPIFGQGASGGGPKAYYPSVLVDTGNFSGHDGGFTSKYKMWFDDGVTIRLATSGDGVAWTDRVASSLSNDRHPLVKYFSAGFPGVNSGANPSGATMYYRLWYWYTPVVYGVTAMRYAESDDGITWFNDQPLQNGTVPIVTGVWPDWNYGSYGPADLLFNPAASNTGTDWKYELYYDGTTGGTESIGLAFSSDAVTWTGYDGNADGKADPVFTGTGTSSDWDFDYVSRATIIKNSATDYEMWYSGGSGSMQDGIGYATSTDGIGWVRQGRIFHKSDGNPWRSVRAYTPVVIRYTLGYRMWFAGLSSDGKYSIGCANCEGPTAVTLAGFSAEPVSEDDKALLLLLVILVMCLVVLLIRFRGIRKERRIESKMTKNI